MVTREELRQRYGRPSLSVVPDPVPPAADDPPVVHERAFVVRGETGRTVISAPVREVASHNEGFTYLRGRFVEADTPNRNGAMWTTGDLQMGEATVAGGPLNWLHDEEKIVGSFLDGHLVAGKEAAAAGIGNHIVSNAAMWRFLYPREVDTVEKAAADNSCWFSMECVSRQVMCVDGCGEAFDYAVYNRAEACQHLRERSSTRRFIDPIFLGGALIVPPVQPGWSQADVEVVRQAAQVAEEFELTSELTQSAAERMVTQILLWANRDVAMTAAARHRKPTMPGEGERYPIGNTADLKNAIMAFGRGDPADKDKIRRWIIRRARELNAVGMLPDSWGVKK
jgi:hypothetical protein